MDPALVPLLSPSSDASVDAVDAFDVENCMDDLGKLQLRTYDCSFFALRDRLSRRISVDADLLVVQIRSGVDHLHLLQAERLACLISVDVDLLDVQIRSSVAHLRLLQADHLCCLSKMRQLEDVGALEYCPATSNSAPLVTQPAVESLRMFYLSD